MRQENINRLGRRALHVAMVVAALIGVPGLANATSVYGLIVGIDDYVGKKNDLAGAVNDARDISRALAKLNASRVITLTDAKATKKAIKDAWFVLVKQAKAGDTIIFTYAGHGAQEPEPAGRNGEADGKNENFLLAGFTPKGPGRAERIVDDEIFEWLKVADAKGVQVIFVADSCHSGSMHRSASAIGVKFRNGSFGKITVDEDLLADFPPPAIAKMTEKDLKNVTFIAATQEDKLTPEVEIDGRPRGALSWAFARALEGAADKDKDGQLTQVELVRFLVPAVHQQVESQQTPEVRPLRPRSQPIVAIGRAPPAVEKRKPAGARLKLAIIDAKGPHLSAISGYSAVILVKDAAAADLVWHAGSGLVEHKIGGKVAEGAKPATIKGILAKWAAIKLLRARAHAVPVEFSLPSGNHRYAPGGLVSLHMRGAQLPYLTLFNVAPNGRIEFFIPAEANEASKDWRGQVMKERFKVERPPYGAEHVIALFTKDIQAGLHSVLKVMKTAEHAHNLPDALAQFLKGVDYQLGIAGIYTGREE